MNIADVTQQISDIRDRLALLSQTVSSSDGGAGFASALSGATATPGASATSGVPVSGAGVTGDDVVAAARQYQGVPYVLGGESKRGIDCSGLVQAAFKQLGIDVPRLVHEQQTIGQAVPSLKDARPGDLIVLNGGDHIAIWTGNGQAIHAPYPGRVVSAQKAWFDDSDITTIRRVVPAAVATTSGSAAALAASTVELPPAAPSAAVRQAVSLMGAFGGSSGTDPLSSLLSGYGPSGSGSTAQQLVAARAALAGS